MNVYQVDCSDPYRRPENVFYLVPAPDRKVARRIAMKRLEQEFPNREIKAVHCIDDVIAIAWEEHA